MNETQPACAAPPTSNPDRKLQRIPDNTDNTSAARPPKLYDNAAMTLLNPLHRNVTINIADLDGTADAIPRPDWPRHTSAKSARKPSTSPSRPAVHPLNQRPTGNCPQPTLHGGLSNFPGKVSRVGHPGQGGTGHGYQPLNPLRRDSQYPKSGLPSITGPGG